MLCFFFFQAEDGIRDKLVTGVQTCALPICSEDPQVKQLNPLFKVEDEGVIVNKPAHAEGAQGVVPPQTAPFEEGNLIAADRGFQPASKDEGVLLAGVWKQHPVFNPIPTEYRIRTGREGLRQLRKHRKVVTD